MRTPSGRAGSRGQRCARRWTIVGRFAGTLADAMERLAAATAPGDVILVMGSFDVVERARARLGLDGR